MIKKFFSYIYIFLTIISLTFVPVLVWRGTLSSLGLRKNWLQIQERLSLLTKVMDENLNGIRVVRAFYARDHELKKYDEAAAKALEALEPVYLPKWAQTEAEELVDFLARREY